MSKNLYLPQDRYRAALKRQQYRIAYGVKLDASDCTATGMKSTECSWGLCSDEREAWPDAQDHLWPDQFRSRGRVAPLYREKNQKCPLDRRALDDPNPNGCFYTCMVFNPLKGEKRPTKEQVVELYAKRREEVK